MEYLTWIGILACLLHSAMFSGLNLALFGPSRLQLEVEADGGNADAKKILLLRKDANFLLTTILWGNVAVNCLLTLLTDSILAGGTAFIVSTVGITFGGEIVPQAYFSRHAMRMGSLLQPIVRLYQKVLWLVAKPSAMLLDAWLGREGPLYLRERHLRAVIERHMAAEEADLERREGQGALNFLVLDDLPIAEEGEALHPDSVIALPVSVDLPVIPEFAPRADDSFVRRVAQSGRKWVVLTGEDDEPLLVLDADQFLRDVLFAEGEVRPYASCHRPVVVTNPKTPIGTVLRRLRVHQRSPEDDVIDHDLILLWGRERRIVTGADLLGRLMRGIVAHVPESE